MRLLTLPAYLLGLSAALMLATPEPALAGGKSVKRHHGKTTTYVVRRGLFGRRTVVVRKTRVKGFSARVGGYSFNVGKTYDYDPHAARPRDFGPQHDITPSRGGIIPTRLYP